MQLLISTLVTLALLFSGAALAKDFTPNECPVVGNTSSMIYHTQGQKYYDRMLTRNKGKDNRRCFKTEQEAQKQGYRKSKV
jgi:hypothetical protein